MHESHKLQSIGCEVGQGYLFAKPMPQAKLIGHLRARMTGRAAAHAVNGRLATI
jgi:EAL domain-containing protein (putative c-di-GMP-specific phosphodiesterase class I)